MTVERSCMQWMLALVGLMVLLLWLAGCSLLKVESEKMPDLPARLEPRPALIEHERQALDWSWNVAGLIFEQGAAAKSQLVGQLRDVIGGARTRLGLPFEALTVPDSLDERDKPADALVKKLRRENAAHRAAQAKWDKKYEETRGTPLKKSFTLGALSWLGSTTGIMAIGLVILCPSLLKVALSLFKRYKAVKTAFEEVVGGVDALLGDKHAAHTPATTREILRAHRSPETKEEIRRTKIRLGLPVNPKEVRDEG